MNPTAQAGKPPGARASEADLHELGSYLDLGFEVEGRLPVPATPLADEPFAGWWAPRLEEARAEGACTVLARSFPQLQFPVRSGISRDPAYRAATLRGVLADRPAEATALPVERPEEITLHLHPSLAGRILVLIVRHRPDFVTLVRALAKRNEPVVVPPSQGAAMVAGLPDWRRIRFLRGRWQERGAGEGGAAAGSWADEWARLVARPESFQVRLVVLSDGPYSGVPASDLGLADESWRQISLVIRREHECCHYFTRRVFGSMRNHLLDELIADYVGMVAAVGRFRAEWFLRFLGLRGASADGRRVEIYRGKPPLSDGAFALLLELVEAAAANLERFDGARWPAAEASVGRLSAMVQALATLRLDELASARAPERLEEALRRVTCGSGV